MKKKYESVRIDVRTFAVKDIICVSTALTNVTLDTLHVDASKVYK